MAAYKHTDGRTLLLGKKKAAFDPHHLYLAKYLPNVTAPTALDYTKGQTSFGMMLNDTLGDCTIAGIGHQCQIWTLNTDGAMQTVPDNGILNYYEEWCGYVDGNPETDQGGFEPAVLNHWHNRKKGFWGNKLIAYADPSPQDENHVRLATWLFGGLYIGLGLPLTAQNQVGSTWSVVGNPQTDANSQPYSWGGHCVTIVGYDTGGLTCITWGQLQYMTWEFWATYCDESHALLGEAWVDWSTKNAPSGFDFTHLYSDQATVNN